jgi:hypothetical protein
VAEKNFCVFGPGVTGISISTFFSSKLKKYANTKVPKINNYYPKITTIPKKQPKSTKNYIFPPPMLYILCTPSPCHHPLTPFPHTALAPTSPPPSPLPFFLINIAYLLNLSKRKKVVIMRFLKFFGEFDINTCPIGQYYI